MSQRDRPGPALGHYDLGLTPLFALKADRRFSYCLAVPPDYDPAAKAYSLIVLIHGTGRRAMHYRDAFADFAAAHDCIALAPLFPAGMTGSGDLGSYKFIGHGGIRYDEVLFAMVEEVAAKYRLDSRQFLLHGFSGGGHFAHRMLILHPGRLRAVSIGAPGLVTMIDPGRPWWVGTADIQEKFGVGLDLEAMGRVPVQMVIGSEDTETWEITLDRRSAFWMEAANDAGATRLDRLSRLKESFESHGIAVQLDVVPGAAHVAELLFPRVQAFMSAVLGAGRGVR
ncbi:MAG: alpha/beta hydrolase [Acetobacteraceae bacterium]